MRVMTTGIIFCTKTYNLNSLTQEFGRYTVHDLVFGTLDSFLLGDGFYAIN